MGIIKSIKNYFKYGVPGDKVRLETSSMCQLRCPECPQSEGDLGVIGQGYLKFDDFKKFVDDYPEFKAIEISNYGEPFLNPDIRRIIEYAYDNGIALTAENGVNLNSMDDKLLEDIVKFNFRAMYVSLDGALQETYSTYRIGGNLEKVLYNIRKINDLKKKYNSPYPKLSWQFIVFGHNENDIPQARRMAEELGMDFKPKLNAHPGYSPIRDKDFVKDQIGFTSREEYEEVTGNLYKFPCYQLWFSPMINWDGKLLGCCLNEWEDFGNVFEKGLKKCINSEKYAYTKQMLLGRKTERDNIPCLKCAVYPKVKKFVGNSWLPEIKFMAQVIKVKFVKVKR